MVKIDWELYSWILRGSQRRKILVVLNKPKIPTEIKTETKLSIAHVSKILKLFEAQGIVECLTPNVRMGKIYALTKKGETIRKQVIKGSG
ncbi:MAG: ArsR family transcriptional regulator [Nanoarchaeota archaeon]|nr:ArsR family transcriptional regulator [Nanoarchaeota archaeon]MBU4451491.1 ArsR family transcriptional regulator [Nanoarchaeota archaeon]MCG2723858.1 ArsR family transcriptional regulator [archaeon]